MKILIGILLYCVVASIFAVDIPYYTPSQLAVIKQRGYLKVAIIDNDHPPFIFKAPGQPLQGLDIELAQNIAMLLQVKLRIDNRSKNYGDLIQKIYQKQDDIAVSAIVSVPSRAKAMYLSAPYLRSPIGLLVNRIKYDHLETGKIPNFNFPTIHIGSISSSAYIGYIHHIYPQATIVPYDNETKLLSDVMNGSLDACMDDDLFIKTWLAEKPERALHTRYIVLPGYYASYAVATSYGYPILGKWLDNFIQEAINLGFMNDIIFKYSSGKY